MCVCVCESFGVCMCVRVSFGVCVCVAFIVQRITSTRSKLRVDFKRAISWFRRWAYIRVALTGGKHWAGCFGIFLFPLSVMVSSMSLPFCVSEFFIPLFILNFKFN